MDETQKKRGRGRPKGSTAKSMKERLEKAKPKRAKRGRPPNAEKRDPVQQLVAIELVRTGEGFGQDGYKARKAAEEEFRRKQEAGDAAGQFEIPYPFIGGRRKALDFNEHTLTRIWTCGSNRLTHAETAAALGVSLSTLQRFFKEHPESEEVFDDAILVANGSLRAFLAREATAGNTPVLLHVAKHWLGLTDKVKEDDSGSQLKDMMTQVADRLRAKYLAAVDQGETVGIPPNSH
jgi:hypothetical protein